MEWVTRCVLLINLLLINLRLSATTPVTAEKNNFGDGICVIRRTTIASTVTRSGDCKQMLLELVNVSNPSQEVFDSITDGLNVLIISDSHVRSVFLPPNLISLQIYGISGDETQVVIDRKFSYKLQDLKLTNLPRIPVNLSSLQSLKVLSFTNMPETTFDFTIFSKMVQLEEITLDNFGNMIITKSFQLPSLRKLNIFNLPIKTVNGTSVRFPSLENLDLHNSLQTNAQYVSKNQAGWIALDDFVHLKQLEELSLENCKISELSTKSLVHFPALTVINLNKNQLTQLSVKLWRMPKLTMLSLRYNRLKQIAGAAQLLTLKGLTLTMYDNPCDCQWVKATREQFPEAMLLASKPCTQQAISRSSSAIVKRREDFRQYV